MIWSWHLSDRMHSAREFLYAYESILESLTLHSYLLCAIRIHWCVVTHVKNVSVHLIQDAASPVLKHVFPSRPSIPFAFQRPIFPLKDVPTSHCCCHSSKIYKIVYIHWPRVNAEQLPRGMYALLIIIGDGRLHDRYAKTEMSRMTNREICKGCFGRSLFS